MRTLVISDLHLGARRGRDRLQAPAVRERLCAALADVDRLVLLGDIVELRHGPIAEAMAAALPVLDSVSAALPPGAEVIVVPGNHDHHFLGAWLARRAASSTPEPLALENRVAIAPGDPIDQVVSALGGGERVRVAYPGVWLSPGVWATHGHYLDRHTTIPMFERLGVGVTARLLGLGVGNELSGAASIEEYEAVLAPTYAWLHTIAQTPAALRGSEAQDEDGASAALWSQLSQSVLRSSWKVLALRGALPGFIGAVNRAGIGPVRSELSGEELRRAALRALCDALARLNVDAEHVVFGHTHRAGPLPADIPSDWRARSGARLTNTGCWVHEPAFLGPAPASSPYRVGFAVRLEDGGSPELVNLLD